MHADIEIKVFHAGTCVLLQEIIVLECREMTYRVKQMVIATDAGPLFTFSDLRPEREEQDPNTGQPHEDTPAKKGRRMKKREKRTRKLLSTRSEYSSSAISFILFSNVVIFQLQITIKRKEE